MDSFIGRSACEYLKQAEGPFCLFVSFTSPHNPYDPPVPYDGLYRNVSMPARNMGVNEIEQKPREAYDYINNRIKWGFRSDEITEEQRLDMWRCYYGLNTLVDDWVGAVMKTLDECGFADDTITIYASDHGDLLGDHGLFYKQCFYEQSVRVPLIVHGPGRFMSRRTEEKVELMDVFSTLCELADAEPGPGVQACTLVPILKNQEHSEREAVFSENYFGTMVRWKEWKMVYYPGKPYGEIYNLEEDPYEQTNLWDVLEGSLEKREMKDILLDWAFTSADPLPLPVRPGHFDAAPQRFDYSAGGTREADHQPWHLASMRDFYKDYQLTTEGRMR